MLYLFPVSYQNINTQYVQNIKNTSNNKRQLLDLKYDSVNFSGQPSAFSAEKQEILANAKNRKSFSSKFQDKDIPKIYNALSEKNRIYLTDILKLGNSALDADGVIELLQFVDEKDTNLEEFSQKISNFNNLKEYVTGRGFKKSILSDYTENISSKDIVNLLKSDLLLDEPKNNYAGLTETWQYAVELFELNAKKEKISEIDLKYKAKAFMRDTFVSAILLSMIYNKNTCNEFFYNRGQYIKDNYIPRLLSLNENDLILLRTVATNGVTDKENSSGDLSGYPISLDDKISMLNYLATNRNIIKSGSVGTDVEQYIIPVNKNIPGGNVIVDFQGLKIDLMDKVLRHIGIPDRIVDKYQREFHKAYKVEKNIKEHRDKFWDINYPHLINAPKGTLLNDIVISATLGNFNKLLFENGIIAETNKKNKLAFEEAGIDYEKWLNPKIKPETKIFKDRSGTKVKNFTIKNWNRCPQESLFDGNYTTCCTGIDKEQGDSFLTFLTNTCTTTFEVRTDKNKVVGMSRLFVAKINGKLSLIVENIEVNNKIAKHYLYSDSTRYKYREMIFDYARKFAKHINKNNEDMPIYFSGKYFKVKDIEKGLLRPNTYWDIDLIGKWPEKIYINAYGGCYDKSSIRDESDELNLTLIDITNKPKFSTKNETIESPSDSNYNYQDVSNFNS